MYAKDILSPVLMVQLLASCSCTSVTQPNLLLGQPVSRKGDVMDALKASGEQAQFSVHVRVGHS